MIAPTLVLFAQLAAAAPRPAPPVLAFPEAGLDDSAAYAGYQTRFYRDAAGNTVQLYLDQRASRAVHLWANAENESAGFTARDAGGRPAALRWGAVDAAVAGDARTRTVEYRLVADAPAVHLGAFVLGSMRVERDFQYENRQRAPFAAQPFRLPELERLATALAALPPAVRARHLALLGAADAATLRARLTPTVGARTASSGRWVARVVQPSLDARDTIAIEVEADPRLVRAAQQGDSVTLRARSGRSVPFTLRVSTTGRALTPLARDEIFTPEFLAFVAAERRGPDAVRARRLERQVRGVELLSSREKLMAGLPTYATYFGRDMMVSALMMRPIWRGATSEAVIASVLRKLSPAGEVSHEEALGGQAVREAAAEYVTLLDAHRRAAGRGDQRAADTLLARAAAVLAERRRVRENYNMIDDEFQLPVLVARWLGDPAVSAAHKRAFLLDSADGGGTRARRLLRELALVARLTAPYAARPEPANLVSFPPRDSGQWGSASWRDSRVGYAGGRYAMDVNTIWAPLALESLGRILADLRTLGLAPDTAAPELAPSTPLGRYARDPAALGRAAATWNAAARHFLVALGPAQLRERVAARLAAMSAPERAYWTPRAEGAMRDSLVFLAVALDAAGRPLGVANTDPATRLFLGAGEGGRGAPDAAEAARVLRDVRLFTRAYPVGLLIDEVGPVVANDAYATPAVWRDFERDRYHGPRVVWGRELNLFLLGVAGRIADAGAGRDAYVGELRTAADRVRRAAEASGFTSELWSYEVRGGRVVPMRYGTGADLQLWSTTDLAVEFALARLRR